MSRKLLELLVYPFGLLGTVVMDVLPMAAGILVLLGSPSARSPPGVVAPAGGHLLQGSHEPSALRRTGSMGLVLALACRRPRCH